MPRNAITRAGLAAAIALSATTLTACATASARPDAPAAAASYQAPSERPITEQEVIAAQNAWGDALVAISTAYDDEGLAAARRIAETVIDTAYGYNLGPVLFKPTLTVTPQTFRTTRAGAISYFIANDPAFPSDGGFALKSWRSYEIENAGIFINGDVAISMGKVRVTDVNGAVTEVDKTWGWTRDAEGRLRIVLHHSSLPYQPN
ncbi:phosphoribosyl-AMP cyclohydrolase [bacterium]|nr:phosphoribosyl-AMP cyclohydrolase [bacterium]